MLIFRKDLWGFKDCDFGQFGQFWPILTRERKFLIGLRNRSKLVQRSLFAINDLLIGTKSITLYFIGRVGGWFSHKIFSFMLLHLVFSCYCCSIDLKRQSEHSELRLDTSSLG